MSGRSVNETRFFIRFSETDMAGVFHHSNLFTWFEVGRFALIDELTRGGSLLELEGDTLFVPVTKTRVSFLGLGRFGDELRLETFLKPQATTKLVFYYRLTQVHDGSPVAIGMTEHVVLRGNNRFLFRWPESTRHRMDSFFAEHPHAVTDGKEFDARL